MSDEVPSPGPYTLYEETLADMPRWKSRKQEIKDRLLGKLDDTENIVQKRFRRAIETAQGHDDLIESTITAFGPRSKIYAETGWHLRGVEPLYEVDPELRNPDIIIGHDDRNTLVVVECKTGLSSPQSALKQIRDATEVIHDHHDYLSRKAGCSFERIDRVLCVPAPMVDRAVNAIEKEERENDPDEPIYLWKVYRFEDETLQLHTDFDKRTETKSSHDNRLTEMLDGQEGVATADFPKLTPDFFPETDPYVIMETVFAELLVSREASDASIRRITRDEVYDYLNDQRRIPHYEVEVVAEMLCDDVLSKMIDFGLIEETESEDGIADDVETYKYADPPISGRSSDRILSNLTSEYEEEWVERKAEQEARKEVVAEFRDEHAELSDFFEQD